MCMLYLVCRVGVAGWKMDIGNGLVIILTTTDFRDGDIMLAALWTQNQGLGLKVVDPLACTIPQWACRFSTHTRLSTTI